MKRTISELSANDIDPIINYFLQADHAFLHAMGVDPKKLPNGDDWRQRLLEDLNCPIPERQYYYLMWELDDRPVGHSNINKIIFGTEAYMHLHLWELSIRQSGHGAHFIRSSIDRYFETFNLQTLLCEPYRLNPAPNKTLAKIGFELIKTYETTPGWINFQQTVNRWALTREKWLQMPTS